RLVLRPVMPMVMRGVPAPLRKGLYIMMDTHREAQDLGAPFGKMVDPLGEPVLRGFSLFPWARDKGRGREYLQSFVDAAWTQGVDTGTDEGMRRVVERAGLSWSEAAPIIDNEDWREELEQNRLALYEMGLWGVPSFRLIGPEGGPEFSTWGQDRLWVVEREIRARIERQGSK
ncbi:MAG: 2-hydroxychromene-2-carboxylate isomerase, partial [bacterium]|nr:2-hydroxychromene-2-carboxylate isomerase [bacterium]